MVTYRIFILKLIKFLYLFRLKIYDIYTESELVESLQQ